MYRNADNQSTSGLRDLVSVLDSSSGEEGRQESMFTGSLGGKGVRTCVPDGVLDLRRNLLRCYLFQACLLLRGYLQLGLRSHGVGTHGRKAG